MILGKLGWGFVIKMFFSKKAQFFILSGMLLFLLLFFIYSLETDNSYIVKFSKNSILDNIVYETCIIGKNSNGTQIDGRFDSYELNVLNYCISRGLSCNLTIINNTQIPPLGNWSLLNYTHYNYNIDYNSDNFNVSFDFNC